MIDPQTLNDMITLANTSVEEALASRTDLGRYVTFCTITNDGPAARKVMLRGWENATAIIQTDAATAKIRELQADNRAALLIWMPDKDLQLRLSTRVKIEIGTKSIWHDMPPPARLNYGGDPHPGKPMKAAEDYVPGTDRQRLAVLYCQCHQMEVLHLGANMHRRALFEWDGTAWDGHWIAP